MGWLKDKLKRAAKWVWTKTKAVIRLLGRLVATVWGFVVGIPDLLLGFALPRKKLRLQVFVLANPKHSSPLSAADVQPAIDFVKDTFKKRFNINVIPYGSRWVETIDVGVPDEALEVGCGLFTGMRQDFGEAGDFYARHLAGWNGIPISLNFPVTAFVVATAEPNGCSMGPLTDYVTVRAAALSEPIPNLMAHELGHACNLWDSWGRSNLMWPQSDRGDSVHWWQKNLVRSSRHVTWW